MLKQKFSLLRGFILVVTAFVVILTSVFIYRMHSIESRVLEQRLENIAEKANHHFTESVNYTENVLSYMGRQISSHDNPTDYQYILNLFHDFSKNEKLTNILSWTLVSWVDTQDKLWVDAKLGILDSKKVKNVAKQNHIEKSKEEQWKVKLDDPRKGNTSGKLIIPAAVGVADTNGSYLGSLIFGFDIEKLEQQFAAITIGKGIDFALVNENHQIILNSSDKIDVKETLLDKFNFHFEKSQSFSNINMFSGSNYYIHKLDKYPYALYLEYERSVLWSELAEAFRSNIFEILLALSALWIAAYYFRKHVVLPIKYLSDAANKISKSSDEIVVPRVASIEMHTLAKTLTRIKSYKRRDRYAKALVEKANTELAAKNKEHELSVQELHKSNSELQDANAKIEKLVQIHQEADKEKEEFLRDMYHTLNTPLSIIINGAELCRKELLGPLNTEEYSKYFDAMFDAAMHIKCFTTEFLYPELLDINEIIEKCVKIQRRFATENKSTLLCDIDEEIPPIWGDKLRLRQVILSTLYHSLMYVTKGKQSEISAKLERLADGEPSCLIITIDDNGWGYTEQMREDDWHERFGKEETQSYNRNPEMMKLSLSTIRHMVKLHHGSFDMPEKSGAGSIFTIRLPYLQKEDLLIHPDHYNKPKKRTSKPEDGNSNVVRFPSGKK